MIALLRQTVAHRRSFTLVELLIVILIISILAAMSGAALSAAAKEGKRQRAKMQIARIDALITEKWNSYRFRQLPIRIPPGTDQRTAARRRLDALRELMRMELPDRMGDITWTDPASTNPDYFARPATKVLPNRPALSTRYAQITGFSPNTQNEQAECLFLILSQMKDGDRNAIAFFFESEIGDTDNPPDGLKELLDPWGTPIRFLRWAPGYSIGVPDWTAAPYSRTPAPLNRPYYPPTAQNIDHTRYPDPLDPLKADPRWADNTVAIKPFALKPLIFSAGPDKGFDIINGYYKADGTADFNYPNTIPYNDPYAAFVYTSGPDNGKPAPWIGACLENDGDGVLSYADNVTNHDAALEGQ